MSNVSLTDQLLDISTFNEDILTQANKQKNNKQDRHAEKVISIDDYSQTTNMASQVLDHNQQTIGNCSQTMPETDTADTSNDGLLKYVRQLESRIEKSFDIFTSELRELRSITELSTEIKTSHTFNENLSLKEENSRLKDKINDQLSLICNLDTKLK